MEGQKVGCVLRGGVIKDECRRHDVDAGDDDGRDSDGAENGDVEGSAGKWESGIDDGRQHRILPLGRF